MPTIRNSEQGRRLAEARWRKYREREAKGACVAETWADDALSFAILTKGEQDRLIGTALRQGAEAALAEVAPAAVLVFAEVGIDRATAERAADVVALFVAEAIQAAGGPEVALPTPEAWRATIDWTALYGPDGSSLVTGAVARGSQAEMAEPTGRD